MITIIIRELLIECSQIFYPIEALMFSNAELAPQKVMQKGGHQIIRNIDIII
jgi:hypothetical protein